jgi:outer membrane protein assembly factor BamD
VAFLAGCGGGAPIEAPLDTLSAEQIYKRGEFELESRTKSTEALRYFTEVERLYPYSEWASAR